MHRVGLIWLRNGIVALFALALAAGMFLPVYTDEVGWRFQERAGFDGVDKLFSDGCGANTLARPPLFMMPVRYFSALLNGTFADPFYVRLSGVAYALLWAGLLLLLIRRIARPAEAAALSLCAVGLMALGNQPLLLVMSRPEQPVLLAVTAALLLAAKGWAEEGADTRAAVACRRSAALLALAGIALSYHLKGLFVVPVFAVCLFYASRGIVARRVQAVAGLTLVVITAVALSYWMGRLQCPDDPLLREQFARNNVGALLADARGIGDVLPIVGKLLGNVSVLKYVFLAAPRVAPLSEWLPVGQVDEQGVTAWAIALCGIWALTLVVAAAALALAAWQSWKARRIEPRIVVSLALLAAVLGWSATQAIRNFYEAGLILPLWMLATVFALAAPAKEKICGATLALLGATLGVCAWISIPLIGALWAPSLARSNMQVGYIDEQRNSVPVFGYAALEPEILATARLCSMPEPSRARAVMIDDLTYFTYMKSKLPQHRLGVTGLWKGSITDPVAYLKSRGSSGIIVGCRVLPANLRARAKSLAGSEGKFCCLAPPNW